ncbi:hypothetical protein [Streptomyces sp. NPDC055692]|uniref:hypothetical protein n=1 Tax=Streptomyces sp. NPDC055692 TaxID=3155683 RepID=UPI003445DF51
MQRALRPAGGAAQSGGQDDAQFLASARDVVERWYFVAGHWKYAAGSGWSRR